MFPLNSDDEKNKKKKSEGLDFSVDNNESPLLDDDNRLFGGWWRKDTIPSGQQPSSESYGKEQNPGYPFLKKANHDMTASLPGDVKFERDALATSDSIKSALETMPDSVRYSPFRYHDRTEPWQKHMKKYEPRYVKDGILKTYATSQQAVDDVVNDYYDNYLSHVYDAHRKKQEQEIKDVMRANKNPYAAVSMSQYKNDPMKVIDNTMGEVDMEKLREMVAPLAGRAGYGTDEYIDNFVKPALKDVMIKDYTEKNKPKNSFEYVMRSANANSLLGKSVNFAIGNKSRMQLERESLDAYDASTLERIAGGVGGLLFDAPIFKGLGMMSNAVTGRATSSVTNKLSSRILGYYSYEGMSYKEALRHAERMIKMNLKSRMIQSAAATGLTLGTYDLAHSVSEDVLYNESVDMEKAKHAFLKGGITGGVLGMVGGKLRGIAAGLTGGNKVTASAGVLTVESAVFTTSTEFDKALQGVDIEPIDIVNDYLEGTATLGIMKLMHTKPKGAEHKLDRSGKLKKKLQLSKSEQEELRELNMDYKEFMDMVENTLKFPAAGIGTFFNDVVEKYLAIMQSKDVSATTKSKLMYLIENKITSTPPLQFEYSVEKTEKGNWVLTTYDSEGGKIERHVFEHAGNAKNYLLANMGDFRKNRIAVYERELLQVFDSQNLLRQAGLYIKETGVSADEVSEALYKRAKNMELTPRESTIVREIVDRTSYNETGMVQFLADMRREIERKHLLPEGSMLDNIDLPFYDCTKAENAALDEYEALVRNEAELLKQGADPARAAEFEELGRNSAFKGMSNEEVKHQEVLDFHTNHADKRNPKVKELKEKLIEIGDMDEAGLIWSYEGVDNTLEDLRSYKTYADKIASKLNVKIEYVWDEHEIPRPENGDKYDISNYNNKIRAKGWAELGKKIVINLPNIESIEELERTVVHEAVVHVGLPRLFGNHFMAFLEELYRKATPGVRAGIHDMKRTYKVANNYILIEEYLATLAEKAASTILHSSFYDDLKSFVKNSLVRMNLYTGRNRRVTDDELISLLRQHVKYMKRNTDPSRYRRWVFGIYDAAKQQKRTYTDKEAYDDYIRGKFAHGRFFGNTPRFLYDQKAYNNYEFMPEEQRAIFRKRWNATDEEIRKIKSGESFRLTDEEATSDNEGFGSSDMDALSMRLHDKYNDAMRMVGTIENAKSVVPDFDKDGAVDRAFAVDYQFTPQEFKRRFPSFDEYLIHKLSGGKSSPVDVAGEGTQRSTPSPLNGVGDLKKYFTGPLDIIHNMLQQVDGDRYNGRR